MKHWDLINYLIKQYGYQKSLAFGISTEDCIDNIKGTPRAVHCVNRDNLSNAHFRFDVNEFFELVDSSYMYDLIFINAIDTEEQIDKNIQNSLKHLNPNGTIILNHCNPPSKWHQRSYQDSINSPGQWTGPCWRSIVKLRQRPDLQVDTLNTDWGIGIIRNGTPKDVISLPINFTYFDLEENRSDMLGLISVSQFLEQHNITKYISYKRLLEDPTYDDFFNKLQNESESRLREFTDMILYKENFTLAKFHDGEIANMLSTNEYETNCDGNNYLRSLGDDLIRAYIYFLCDRNAYIHHWPYMYEILEKLQKDYNNFNIDTKFVYCNMTVQKLPLSPAQITFFKTIKNSKRKKLYISNNQMTTALKLVLNIDTTYDVPDRNCYQQKEQIISNVLKLIEPNMIVLVSAGMCAKVLISELSKIRYNVTYLDIGSTFDGLVKYSRDYNSIQGYREELLKAYA